LSDDIRKLLFGDEKAEEEYRKAMELNLCPHPPKPEPGLLARFRKMELEVEDLHRDLWGVYKGGRGRYLPEIHADRPPHRYQGAGRAVWIDWHMRREDYEGQSSKVPLLHRIEQQRSRLVRWFKRLKS
jgi:hypothetical protein